MSRKRRWRSVFSQPVFWGLLLLVLAVSLTLQALSGKL